jgi:hypothetical protein
MRQDTEHVLARLHLRAVLPVLPALLRLDLQAQKWTRGRQFSIRLKTRSGLCVHIDIADGQADACLCSGKTKALVLLLLSDRQLNRLFTKQGLSVPLPIGGFRQIFGLALFARVARRLEHVLNSSPQTLQREHLVELHSDLMWSELIPRALLELTESDPASQALIRPYLGRSAQVIVTGGTSVWIQFGTPALWGTGAPAARADVVIQFANQRVAQAAIDPGLDKLAALGGGKLRVTGLIPLADTLDKIMKRMKVFLRAPGRESND